MTSLEIDAALRICDNIEDLITRGYEDEPAYEECLRADSLCILESFVDNLMKLKAISIVHNTQKKRKTKKSKK